MTSNDAKEDYTRVDIDRFSVLTSTVPIVPELASEIEQARLEAGLSVEDLLKDLRAQRERYYREQYAADQSE